MDFDAAWCPACEQQILPKRIHVPIPQPQMPPAPPPSSPQSSPTSKPNSARKSKLRTRGGLVQGTGRLRANGTIKRTESKQVQQPQAQPPQPVKYRTVIDQSPLPLYCSDECRLADLGSHHRGRPVDPQRSSRSIPSEQGSTEGEDSDLSESSEESSSPSLSTSKPDYSHLDPSIIRMAEIYNFPHLPPPLPVFEEERDYSHYYSEYTSGVMMASKRIRDFCPQPKKKPTGFYPPPPEPKRHIPGWTDGTQGWRESVYSITSPKPSCDPSRINAPPPPRPLHRSGSSSSSPMPHYGPKVLSDDELLDRYSSSFRRAEANPPAQQPASPSSSRSTSSTRRERPLVHPAAQGKLAVPDVKMKVPSRSSSSLLAFSPSSRPSMRSPLSMFTDPLHAKPKRPVVENRSWSYDNVKTYDLMPIPRNIIKRKEKRIVDGEEVEVEVEIVEPLKRLFLFPNPQGC